MPIQILCVKELNSLHIKTPIYELSQSAITFREYTQLHKQRNYFKRTDKVLLGVTVGFKYFSKVCRLTAVNSFTIITSTGARPFRFSVVGRAAKCVLNLVSSSCTMSFSFAAQTTLSGATSIIQHMKDILAKRNISTACSVSTPLNLLTRHIANEIEINYTLYFLKTEIFIEFV